MTALRPWQETGLVPHLTIRQTGDYQTWRLHALLREEAAIEQFIEYWEERNPRLVRRAYVQLSACQRQKRHAA